MQKSDVVGVWVALWQGLGSVRVPQAISELEQILVLMHCSVAAQMESKCHFRLPSPGLFMACSGFRKHCSINVTGILGWCHFRHFERHCSGA